MTTEIRRLRFDQLTVVDLPYQVLENAFWRPQAAKLHGRHKDSLASVSDKEAEKTYQKLRVAWRLEETWINHALNALLVSIPDKSLGRLMGDLCGGATLGASELVKLDPAGIASTTGAPDFIIRGDQSCVLGETKVAAKANSQRYDFQQFTKYQMLGAMVTCARDPAMRRAATHLIVVPDADPAKFCSDYKQWLPRVEGCRLIVDADGVAGRGQKARFSNFGTWRDYVRKTLLDKRVLSRCDLDPENVEHLTAAGSPVLVPTYVVTWAEMMNEVREIAGSEGYRNLGRAALNLEAIAYGRPSVAADEDRLDRFVAKRVVWR